VNLTKRAAEIGELLQSKSLTISAAESCTGGLLTSTLTNISGSSAYVIGSVVSYDNSIKQGVVGVNEQTLIDYGAVSEQTAHEMANGVRKLIKTNIGVGITGIAGPGGGTDEKPVGLTYISASDGEKTLIKRFVWDGDRIANKISSVEAALDLIEELVNQN